MARFDDGKPVRPMKFLTSKFSPVALRLSKSVLSLFSKVSDGDRRSAAGHGHAYALVTSNVKWSPSTLPFSIQLGPVLFEDHHLGYDMISAAITAPLSPRTKMNESAIRAADRWMRRIILYDENLTHTYATPTVPLAHSGTPLASRPVRDFPAA